MLPSYCIFLIFNVIKYKEHKYYFLIGGVSKGHIEKADLPPPPPKKKRNMVPLLKRHIPFIKKDQVLLWACGFGGSNVVISNLWAGPRESMFPSNLYQGKCNFLIGTLFTLITTTIPPPPNLQPDMFFSFWFWITVFVLLFDAVFQVYNWCTGGLDVNSSSLWWKRSAFFWSLMFR